MIIPLHKTYVLLTSLELHYQDVSNEDENVSKKKVLLTYHKNSPCLHSA